MSEREMRHWFASHFADVLTIVLLVGLIVYVVVAHS